MKRKDIPLRVPLAFSDHRHERNLRRGRPVAVIDLTSMWIETVTQGKGAYERAAGWRYMVDERNSVKIGYLVVESYSTPPTTEDDRLDRLNAWLLDLPDELTPEVVTALARKMPEGLDIGVVNGMYLIDTWEAGTAQRVERERLAAEQRERERQRLEWQTAVRDAITERVGDAAGVRFDYSSEVYLRGDTISQLLGLSSWPGKTEEGNGA